MTRPAYRTGWDSADELVHFLSSPYVYRCPDNMSELEFCDFLIEDMERDIEKIGAERIACFIAEPILGAGGVLVPPASYHKRSLEVCRRFEIKYVSDEVVTAFGRLGHMFASKATFDLEPDVITSAKGLSSGYQPISAAIFSDEIYDVLSGRDGMFLHGMTYSGHPACCAPALATIAILEDEDICGLVLRQRPQFEAVLKSLIVRNSHFMMGIEFVHDKFSKKPFENSINIGMRVSNHAQARGVIVRLLGHMTVLSPPLIINSDDVKQIGNILHESILGTFEDLTREKLM